MASVQDVPDEPGQPPNLTAMNLADSVQESKVQEQVITPFDVSGGVDEHGKAQSIDYNKLINKFGSQKLDNELLQRFERVTGHRAHRLMRRGMVFSHRDLGVILDKYEKGVPFFLYTGRGPSSDSMHVGHSIPFEFTKFLQDAFNVPLIIMLTDDEKFVHSQKLSLKQCKDFAMQNAMDIIAIGFDIQKTFIFADSEFIYGGHGKAFAQNILEIGKRTTNNQIRGTFGFNDTNNVLEFAFPATQSAPSFASSFPFIFGYDPKRTAKIPCLIPCAIDQDPYFRQTRDNAQRAGFLKPSVIHTTFLPSLRGSESKMSASDPNSTIYLSDTDNQIRKKIGQAFSGGQETQELHRQLGGRTNVDVAFQYLRYFFEDDDKLEEMRQAYEKGEMSSGEMKKTATQELQSYVTAFRERRTTITPDLRNEYMRPRQLSFRGMPSAKDQKAGLEARKKTLEEELVHLDGALQKLEEPAGP